MANNAEGVWSHHKYCPPKSSSGCHWKRALHYLLFAEMCGRHIQFHFPKRTSNDFSTNQLKNQIIFSDNGLIATWRMAILLSNYGLLYRCLYASLGLSVLFRFACQYIAREVVVQQAYLHIRPTLIHLNTIHGYPSSINETRCQPLDICVIYSSVLLVCEHIFVLSSFLTLYCCHDECRCPFLNMPVKDICA